MLLAYARTIKNDLVFLNTLKLSLKERIHWLNYAVVKEWHRFHSGYIAGKYFTLNDDKKALLDKKMFVRISNSEIVNFNKVENIDFKIVGTLILNFKSGNKAYASRIYIPKIKEFLEI